MLLTLAVGKNPTKTLIAAIRQRGGQGLGKGEDFYLSLRRGGVSKLLILMDAMSLRFDTVVWTRAELIR
jgi:hypothetical protein